MIIDRYAYTNKISKLNPVKKTIFSMLMLLLAIICENKPVQAGIIISMAAVIIYTSEMGFVDYLRLLSIPMIFLITSCIAITFGISTTDTNMLVSINIAGRYAGITHQGIKTAADTTFRALSALSCVYFLMLTTPFGQLITVMKKAKIPDIVIELSMLIYRFIFIFIDESAEIYKAQELKFGYMGLKNGYRSLGMLVSILYKRIIKKYDEMSISLDVKLFDGEFHIK